MKIQFVDQDIIEFSSCSLFVRQPVEFFNVTYIYQKLTKKSSPSHDSVIIYMCSPDEGPRRTETSPFFYRWNFSVTRILLTIYLDLISL